MIYLPAGQAAEAGELRLPREAGGGGHALQPCHTHRPSRREEGYQPNN